jgi:hypothetical protein
MWTPSRCSTHCATVHVVAGSNHGKSQLLSYGLTNKSSRPKATYQLFRYVVLGNSFMPNTCTEKLWLTIHAYLIGLFSRR